MRVVMLLVVVLHLVLMVVVLVEISHMAHSSMKNFLGRGQNTYVAYCPVFAMAYRWVHATYCNIERHQMYGHWDTPLETQKGVTGIVCEVTVIHTEIIDSLL